MAHFESIMGRIIKIRGIANSKTMITANPAAAQGLNLETWQEELAKVDSTTDLFGLAQVNVARKSRVGSPQLEASQ